jgi:hypothetical protein
MQVFAWLILSLLYIDAQALIIGSKSTAGEESSLCRIIYRNQRGKLLSTCSGTLVTPTKILTAKHCIERAPSVSVECGFSGTEGEIKVERTKRGAQVITQGIKFKEIRSDIKMSEVEKVNNDLAVIELQTAIDSASIKPAHFKSSSIQEFFINIGASFDGPTPPELRSDSECKMEGFGINNEGLSGKLISAPVNSIINIHQSEIIAGEEFVMDSIPPKKEHAINACLENYNESLLPRDLIPLVKKINEEKMFESVLTSGDSGGPLLCRKKGTAGWTIVAVASKVSISNFKKKHIGAVSTWQVLSQADWIGLGMEKKE